MKLWPDAVYILTTLSRGDVRRRRSYAVDTQVKEMSINMSLNNEKVRPCKI